MSAHTPGPWHIERSGGGWVREVTNKDGRAICYGSIEDADASLISASPDMYEALKELAECSQYWSEYDVPLGIHDRIAAALAKAAGQ